MFDKEKTDTRDPYNILDWVKVPPVGAKFAFYTYGSLVNVSFDTITVISVDTILYQIYIGKNISFHVYQNDSIISEGEHFVYSIIDSRDNYYDGNTGYKDFIKTPISDSSIYLVDDFWLTSSKFKIIDFDYTLESNQNLWDSLIFVYEYYGNDESPDWEIYFSPKYGINVYEGLVDSTICSKLIWVNY
ncbi:MAG: hypothetical protein PHW02_04585 [bacterium]|nr:hypothetical protein [bacterium]